MSLQIQGLAELRAKLLKISEGVSGPEAAAIFLKAADTIRKDAAGRAPVLRYPERERNGVRWVRGDLKRSIVSFLGKPQGTDPRSAYARVNIFRGRDRAPHGHLVEFGVKARSAEKGRMLAFPGTGGPVFIRRVAAIPPHPFFRPAVEGVGPAALETAAAEMQALVDKRMEGR